MAVLALILAGLNITASAVVLRAVDDDRWKPLVFVWLVPLFGALVTYAVLADRCRRYRGTCDNPTQPNPYVVGA